MASSIGFNRAQSLAMRVERYTDVVEEWMLQAVLVAAIVVALIGGVLSLNGASIL